MKANLIPTASGYLAMDTAMPEMEMYQSFESHRGNISPGRSADISGQLRRKTDATLLRESIESLESEVTERWSSEKERRLQLESRTAELIKELRGLRSSIEKEEERRRRK